GPLSAAESRRLLRHHGVTDPAAAGPVAAFARGNPLLLTVAAQHAQASRSWDAEASQAVTQSLIGQMTRETAYPAVRRLPAAAALAAWGARGGPARGRPTTQGPSGGNRRGVRLRFPARGCPPPAGGGRPRRPPPCTPWPANRSPPPCAGGPRPPASRCAAAP